MTLVRALAGLVLGTLVLAGVVVWTGASQVSGKAFDAEVYAGALSEAGAYERVYTEVLGGPEGETWLRELTGEGLPVEPGELVGMARRLAPPAYLQGQVEGNLRRAAAYFRGETERLDLYLELEEPLAAVTPLVLDYLGSRIDRLEVVELELPAEVGELLEAVSEVAAGTVEERVDAVELVVAEVEMAASDVNRMARETAAADVGRAARDVAAADVGGAAEEAAARDVEGITREAAAERKEAAGDGFLPRGLPELEALAADLGDLEVLAGYEERLQQGEEEARKVFEELEVEEDIEGLSEEERGALLRAAAEERVREAVREAGEEYQGRLREELDDLLAGGELVIPSNSFIPEPLRGEIFDLALPRLSERLELPAGAAENLEAAGPELRERFVAGDDREFVKGFALAIAGPVVEQGVADLAAEAGLDERGRWQLLPAVAEGMGYAGEAELQQELDGLRDRVNGLLRLGRWLSLAVIVVGSVLLGLVFWPNWARGLRWPGVALLLSGLAAFGLGLLVRTAAPGAAAEGVRALAAGGNGNWPPALAGLLGEVAQGAAAGLLAGLGNWGLGFALVGAVLLAAGYWLERRGRVRGTETPR